MAQSSKLPSSDPSTPFPVLYHAHHSRHLEDIPFWLELARRQGSPALELGCGTGRVLLPLAQAGVSVFGLDNDPEMLAVLRRQLTAETRQRVSLLQADLAHYCLALRFALILLPCNTFSTLEADQRLAALDLARRHLLPEGRFAVSLPNPDLLARLPRQSEAELEEVFPHPVDGEPVQVSSGWRRDRECFSLTWHYDHLLSDGRVERTSAVVQHRLVPAETYEAELRQQGLKVIERFGDYDRSEYGKDSPYLILVAAAQ